MNYLQFKRIYSNYLVHFGIKRRSGRYPWGSGERPFQSMKKVVKYMANPPLQRTVDRVIEIDREMERNGTYKKRQERRAEIKDFSKTISPDFKKAGKIVLTSTTATGLSVIGSAVIGSILGLSGIGEALLVTSGFITLNKLGYDYLVKEGIITKAGDVNWEVRMKKINN